MKNKRPIRPPAPPAISAEREIIPFSVVRLIKGGEGLSFCGGKAFFIADALPGETGLAEIIEQKPRYGRARVVERRSASPDRRPDDPCPRAAQCGGCGFRFVNPVSALRLKAKPIYDEIEKSAKIALPPCEFYPVAPDAPRCRMRLHITEAGCGFFARLSHSVMPASDCVAIDPKLRAVAHWLEENAIFSNINRAKFQVDAQIDLGCDGNAYAAFIIVSLPSDDSKKSRSSGKNRMPGILSPVQRRITEKIEELARKACETGILAGAVTPDSVYGESMIKDESSPEGLPPTVTWRRVGDFAQALPQANDVIHALLDNFICRILAQSPPNKVRTAADLFAGSGNLTFRLATKLPTVRAFEQFCDPDAFRRGTEDNAAVFPKNSDVRLIRCDLNRGLPEAAKTADIIVCDPARNGLSAQTARDLLSARARCIFYVSCEASSLARDLAVLKSQFDVSNIAFIDMFPNTPHAETVCLLVRRNGLHIDIDIDADVEKMLHEKRSQATYAQIKEYVLEQNGLKVSSLYISQVKRKCGLDVSDSYNKSKSEDTAVPQCPPEKEEAIMNALRHFGVI